MNLVTQVCLPLAAAAIAFGVGLGVASAALLQTLRAPRPLLTGLVVQLVVLPVVAYLACLTTRANPAVMLGMLILAASPSNFSAPLLTRLARGDVPLSLTLTTATCLLAGLEMSVVITLAASPTSSTTTSASALPLTNVLLGLFLITSVPALLGILVRRRWPTQAARIERRFPSAAVAILLLLVAVVIYNEWDQVARSIPAAGLTATVFGVYSVASTYLVARLAGLDAAQRTSLVIGSGMRQAGTAAFVAITLLRDPELVLPGAAYSLGMWALGPPLSVWAQARRREGQMSEDAIKPRTDPTAT